MASGTNTSENRGTSRQDNNSVEPVVASNCSTMVSGQISATQAPQNGKKDDTEIKSSFQTSHSSSDLSNRSSTLSPEYDSTSLNPKITVQRALNSMYSRWVKVNDCRFIARFVFCIDYHITF
jgi:hypothetical protein